MSALATRPGSLPRFGERAKTFVQRATAAHVEYRRGVLTRRAVRLFRAMDEALEEGDGREAERLFRHASAAVRRAGR